jgi:uncharacterized SAM-binding protein YcdF (DUF218 family)
MIARLIGMGLLAWGFGFVLFAVTLPHPAPDAPLTDGIVVLTGGPGRIERGASLLARGRARRMLVSGAGKRVRLADLGHAYHLAPALLRRIDLGHAAVDTRSNAGETARWIGTHHYRSIRLVTTDWHMARARFELRRVLKDTTVLPDAVPSEPGLLTLVTEYDKFLLRQGAALTGK